MVSVVSAISAISSEKALLVFKTIASSESYDTPILVTKLGLKLRQFYCIVNKLIDADLVIRVRSKYYLTSFGKVVLGAQAKIEFATDNYWKLMALDRMMLNKRGLPAEEHKSIIDKLLGNEEIKLVLF
jgi:predicted transcriptional regulator